MKRTVVRFLGVLLGMAFVFATTLGSVGHQDPAPDDTTKSTFVGNKSSRTYHRADCPLVAKLPAKSKVALESSNAAETAGFKPCAQCQPKADVPGDDEPGEGDAAKPTGKSKNREKGTRGTSSAKPKTVAKANDGTLKFSRDIAPILAGNCNNCHNAQTKRGDFILTTFAELNKGSKSGPVIVPGKPEESLLVELVVERKMPRGGNRRLSDESIAKIREWVRQGAILDEGASPTASLDQVAPSPEQLRKERLSQLPVDQVDKALEQTGLERWKKATTKSVPKVTAGRGFLLFSNLPEARGKSLLRGLDTERAVLSQFFGNDEANILNSPEKISVYVFENKGLYAEFLRSAEQREVELGVEAHARLGVEAPYLVAVDPLSGGEELPASKSKASRKKDNDDLLSAPTRSLSLLTGEALAAGVLNASGKPPKWLEDGFGAYIASMSDPRSPYFGKLRTEAVEQLRIGGMTRLTEALGDQASPEALRALGFSLCEWMANNARPVFPEFVRGMTQQGTAKLDDIVKACFGPESNRDDLLEQWSMFIANQYPSGRRR